MLGIPGECQVDCYKLGGAEGAGAKAPVAFHSTTMLGGWAQKLYYPSHDGKFLLMQLFGGFLIQDESGASREYKIKLHHRRVQWGPDNRKLILGVPEGFAIADVTALGEPGGAPKSTLVYKTPPTRHPVSVGWAPSGTEIFVLEHYEDPKAPNKLVGSAIQRVSLDGRSVEILHHPTRIGWFTPPRTRYEDGSGPSSKPFQILFGAQDGIYIMDRDGQKEKLSDLTPEGIEDIVWSPGNEKTFAILFRNPQVRPDGKGVWKGIYLAHLDRKGLDLEQLYDKLDAHTFWFSAKGRRVAWASSDVVSFRDVEGKPDSVTHVELKDVPAGQIKGCRWDPSEQRLAVAAGNRIFVHDVAGKVTTLRAKLGDDDGKAFCADPEWRGDEILFTVYTNLEVQRRKN